jgi:CBS domain-containing protein
MGVRTLAMLMRDRHVGAVVIVKKNRPVGIVTDRDLVCRVMAAGRDPLGLAAKDVMTANVLVAREGAPVGAATELMRSHGIRRVPVVNKKGRLVNVMTLDDLLVVLGGEVADLGRAVLAGMRKEHLRGRPVGRRAAAGK